MGLCFCWAVSWEDKLKIRNVMWGGFFLILILICYSSSIGGCCSALNGYLISLKTVSWPRQGYPEAQPCRVRCRVVHQEPAGGEMLVEVQGASQHLWVLLDSSKCGGARSPLAGWSLWKLWDSVWAGIPLQFPFQRAAVEKPSCFHLPTPQMHLFPCLTSPSYPQTRFHLFSLLCSNCFYTVSNAPQVPSIHNCCYLVKCFP